MIRRSKDMKEVVLENLRGGDGAVSMLRLLEKEDMREKMSLCAISTIPPGAGIGEHEHTSDSEIYYVLEGEVQVTDEGEEYTLYAGDIMFTGDGESHQVWNASEKDAKLFLVVMNI